MHFKPSALNGVIETADEKLSCTVTVILFAPRKNEQKELNRIVKNSNLAPTKFYCEARSTCN